ncbi:FIST N-terminal domain-containing protein [Deefgea sp. CFH1-16]|uniref:FIST N-terminal domain-containing protein n=1 Tax=Deefgea sp. CFH1-16 TaxID=2675457 RepID=UPI0015F4C3DA|nr:FIST N-terminal domain-containing protein [Deefgea sp. CFH1-16]
MHIASGYAHGPRPTPQVAIAAVSAAMARGGLSQAGSIYLFLSMHFQHDISNCLRAVTQVTGSFDIFGASAAGVFSDQDWSLDAPAAAALVLPAQMQRPSSSDYFSLAAPNTINSQWLNQGGRRFGGIAGDATGQGAYAIWQQGRPHTGFIQTPLTPRDIIVSQGFQALSPFYTITASNGLMLDSLEHQPAYLTLKPWLNLHPLHHLMAGLNDGTHTTWIPVIGVDERKQSVMLAHAAPPAMQLCWGHFDSQSASHDLGLQLMRRLAGKPQPKWALIISGHRRVIAGNGLHEPDWSAIRCALPGVPFAGFYGNGQIVPLAKSNQVVDNSVVIALFD